MTANIVRINRRSFQVYLNCLLPSTCQRMVNRVLLYLGKQSVILERFIIYNHMWLFKQSRNTYWLSIYCPVTYEIYHPDSGQNNNFKYIDVQVLQVPN